MDMKEYKKLFDMDYYRMELTIKDVKHIRFFREIKNAEKASKSASITKNTIVQIFDKNDNIINSFSPTKNINFN